MGGGYGRNAIVGDYYGHYNNYSLDVGYTRQFLNWGRYFVDRAGGRSIGQFISSGYPIPSL